MKALCKKTYYGFEKGNYYDIVGVYSVFETNDFITIESKESIEHRWYRFRLNKSLEYVDDYIGKDEAYFYDYFINITKDRKEKLEHLKNVT